MLQYEQVRDSSDDDDVSGATRSSKSAPERRNKDRLYSPYQEPLAAPKAGQELTKGKAPSKKLLVPAMLEEQVSGRPLKPSKVRCLQPVPACSACMVTDVSFVLTATATLNRQPVHTSQASQSQVLHTWVRQNCRSLQGGQLACPAMCSRQTKQCFCCFVRWHECLTLVSALQARWATARLKLSPFSRGGARRSQQRAGTPEGGGPSPSRAPASQGVDRVHKHNITLSPDARLQLLQAGVPLEDALFSAQDLFEETETAMGKRQQQLPQTQGAMAGRRLQQGTSLTQGRSQESPEQSSLAWDTQEAAQQHQQGRQAWPAAEQAGGTLQQGGTTQVQQYLQRFGLSRGDRSQDGGEWEPGVPGQAEGPPSAPHPGTAAAAHRVQQQRLGDMAQRDDSARWHGQGPRGSHLGDAELIPRPAGTAGSDPEDLPWHQQGVLDSAGGEPQVVQLPGSAADEAPAAGAGRRAVVSSQGPPCTVGGLPGAAVQSDVDYGYKLEQPAELRCASAPMHRPEGIFFQQAPVASQGCLLQPS